MMRKRKNFFGKEFKLGGSSNRNTPLTPNLTVSVSPSCQFAQRPAPRKISFVQPIQKFAKTIDKNSEMV